MTASIKNSLHTMDDRFERIFEEYEFYIKRVVYMYMKNPNIVEDLCQEIWIKVFRNLNKFKGECSIKTWIYRITINHCKDYIRSNYNQNIPIEELVIKDSRNSPENELILSCEKEKLEEIICSLPSKYKEIVSLYYIEEKKLKEISNEIDLNENSVRVRLFRARKLIKTTYFKEFA